MHNLIPAYKYCHDVFDGTHATPKPQIIGKPLVTSKHILDGKLDIEKAYKISLKDYQEINKRSQIHQWDILFSMIGTIGTLYLEKHPIIEYAIKNIGVFSCRNEKKARYLYYFLQSEFAKKYIQKQLAGAVQKFLPLGELRKFPVPVYNENIYKNISVLKYIDDKIELNNKINYELEKVAKELYDYWFIQFEFPDKNNRPYKSNNGKMIYNETLKRKIPYNWTVDKLKKFCDIKSGYPFSSDNYVSNGIYGIITIKNVQNGYIDIHTDNYINSLPSDLPQYCVLEKGDILLSLTGNVGRVGLIYTDNLLLNQRVAKIVPKSKYLYSYIYFLIKNNHFRSILEQKSTGTSQKNLSPIETENIDIIVPDKNTIEEFDRNVKSIIEKIVNNWTENAFLIDLRDFLLPMLMNGQISIKD